MTHFSPASPTNSIESLVQLVKTAGLDTLCPAELDKLVSAVAAKIEHNMDVINPDRWYSIDEIQQKGIGPKKGRWYKAYQHLIKKDGRKSYILGRDLLALPDNAPTMANNPDPVQPTPARRPRG